MLRTLVKLFGLLFLLVAAFTWGTYLGSSNTASRYENLLDISESKSQFEKEFLLVTTLNQLELAVENNLPELQASSCTVIELLNSQLISKYVPDSPEKTVSVEKLKSRAAKTVENLRKQGLCVG